VGVRAEVRAKKPATSGAARAGIPDGGGRWSRWGVPAKARTPLRSIPDLAVVADGDRVVAAGGGRTATSSSGVSLGEANVFELKNLLRVVGGCPARHRIEFHIVKFTSHVHDEFLQRVECVNNIWFEANQCLTARVITMRTDFYL
jgi:hypothetical protein